MEVARRQRGVITLVQLRQAGLRSDAITRQVKTGWLVRLHQGVYAVATIGAIGRVQAGLLACGREAMACEHSSAALPRPPLPDRARCQPRPRHFAAGVMTLRITARKLEREPHAVTARLGAALLRDVA